jgi:hypothetical protein
MNPELSQIRQAALNLGSLGPQTPEELERQRQFNEQARQEFISESQEALRNKQALISGSNDQGKVSPQMKKLLSEITSSTLSSATASLHKVTIALKFKLHDINLPGERVAYIGAGLDWRFPVALGARNLDMVDLEYGRPGLIGEMYQDIRQVDEEAAFSKSGSSGINFSLDLGSGPEAVNLNLLAVDASKYQPQLPLSAVLEYLGPTRSLSREAIPVLPNIAAHLLPGAMIANFDFERYYPEDLSDKGVSLLDVPNLRVARVTSVEDLVRWVNQSGSDFPSASPRGPKI